MDATKLLAQLGRDTVAGVGVIKDLRRQDVFAKKDKEKKTPIGERFTLEISKLNAVLSIDLSQEMHTRLTAELAQENLIREQSFISYEAEIPLEADAFGWSNEKGSGAMATSKYGSPKLTNYKKVS